MLVLLRSTVFNTLMALSVPIWVIVFFLAVPFDFRWRFAVARSWGHAMLWLLKVVCRLDYRVEWEGKLPKGPCVVLCKHESAWETMGQIVMFDAPQSWVMKKELLYVPFFGWAMYFFHTIAIDRSAGRRAVDQVIEQGLERLRNEQWVMIFPEGHRMPVGKTRRYGISGAVLAKEAGVPVIPVCHNAGDFWGRVQFGKQPGTVRMVIGEPIDPTDKSPREINEQAQLWIETQLRQISPDRDYEYPTAEEAVAACRRNGPR
ncbi:1-acyl-sn-glycerol-3-phosphate acyltransferase [Natronospira proteinivora]|uniref:1-acyl-sn-glycerol-3-phosphate acyltransferase n=1 Tax=Natronospira proteinivora TaxID=1807133 RepID=A0ABT1GA10_9GAMM|nr:lysophospholipid acyltransferase family protein [Natronospira proteinivora]MCP1728159.1 1-acyl-sn-glycerol-3-phosphate acyltransferase [Natronospira proteinivora]